jgi:uncharacterized protein YigE (DUF2233 family)
MLTTTLLLLSVAVATPARTQTVRHLGDDYHVVWVDLRQADLTLLGQAPGDPHRFADLPDDVVAATNASLFHTPDQPVGLWVQAGVEHQPLELRDGDGNFFLKPNGLFHLSAQGPDVTGASTPQRPGRSLAIQSGPLLLDDGVVHPRLDPSSRSKKLRNAVSACDVHTVALVLTAQPVRLHDLATLFRDALDCDDALYLDGSLSGLMGPGLPPPADRHDVAGFLVVTERPPPAPGLADGDVVFQRSRSAQAAAIAAATGSAYTHVGMVRLVDGVPHVLEAVQPVRLTPFDAWAARGIDGHVAVRRHRYADQLWTPDALARLDALQARWLGRPYDSDFLPGDDALYCSELVRLAYLGATGLSLADLRPLGSYDVTNSEVHRQMQARWGEVPHDRLVVAPSDLLEHELWEEVVP